MDEPPPGRGAEDDPVAIDRSWEAFAAGDFARISTTNREADDSEWETRNPLHHVADVYLHRFGEPSGRSTPAEFWWAALVFVVVTSVLVLNSDHHGAIWPVSVGWMLLGGIAVAAAAIRRFHDTGRSGAKLLLWVLPFGGIYVLYVLAQAGDLRDNDHGPPRVAPRGALGKQLYCRST